MKSEISLKKGTEMTEQEKEKIEQTIYDRDLRLHLSNARVPDKEKFIEKKTNQIFQ